MQNRRKYTVCLVIGLCLLLVYLKVRTDDLKKVRSELATVESKRNELNAASQEVTELTGRYGNGTDVPIFVGQMHDHARQLGIVDDYELGNSTRNNQGDNASALAKKQAAGEALTISHLRISLRGEFRGISEYLRLLQADRNPKKFVDLKLVQEKGIPRLNLNLDLYSYRGKNGA